MKYRDHGSIIINPPPEYNSPTQQSCNIIVNIMMLLIFIVGPILLFLKVVKCF